MAGIATDQGSVLDRIIARKHEEVAERRQRLPLAEIRGQAADAEPTRGFRRSLQAALAAGLPAVIAEIKRASPSKGLLRPGRFHVAEIARGYQRHGASCLSVLTDRDFFQGCEAYLQEARRSCDLPVLRKDFTVDPYQVYETRAIGADAILLIVAALSDGLLAELHGLALEIGLDVLVEVHDRGELERALKLNPALLGINNRNLRTFETSIETSVELARVTPEGILTISESGIHSTADVQRLRSQNIHAFLVGEAFMRAERPGQRLQELFG